MIAEIYGKETCGCSRGRGMEACILLIKVLVLWYSTVIAGNTIPVGAGLALSIKLDKKVIIYKLHFFIGDGKAKACFFVC